MQRRGMPSVAREASEGWTRTQTIRTVGQIPFDVAILETAEPPTYQRIAPQARRLSHLGLPALRIAQALGVTDKTVTKALRWVRRNSR